MNAFFLKARHVVIIALGLCDYYCYGVRKELSYFNLRQSKGESYNQQRLQLLRAAAQYTVMHGTNLYELFIASDVREYTAANLIKNAQINIGLFLKDSYPQETRSAQIPELLETLERKYTEFKKQSTPITVSQGLLPSHIKNRARLIAYVDYIVCHFDEFAAELKKSKRFKGRDLSNWCIDKAITANYKDNSSIDSWKRFQETFANANPSVNK
jgi:hypothetical protein